MHWHRSMQFESVAPYLRQREGRSAKRFSYGNDAGFRCKSKPCAKVKSGEEEMSVARITEISATSNESFEDAIKQGVARATETLHGIRSAWIKEQEVQIENGKISAYKVIMKITFVLDES